jgi:glucan phosphoethanolaminetransferase (alkaline phosphatase superfamily)
MQLANLTEQESKNINVIGFIIGIIVIAMFGILMFYHFFAQKKNKMLHKIVYGLSAIYLILVIAASIVYFVYRNNREKVTSENSDIVIKPLAAMIIGVCVVALIKYIVDYSSSNKTGGSYFALSSTSDGPF